MHFSLMTSFCILKKTARYAFVLPPAVLLGDAPKTPEKPLKHVALLNLSYISFSSC